MFPGNRGQCYTWESEPGKDQTHPFPLSKGGGALARVLKYLLFVLWVPFIVLTRGRRGDVAIFMDLETAILGVPAARLKGLRAVFDIVDPFAQTKVSGASLQHLVDRVEVAVAEAAGTVLIPHSCRIDYYQSRLNYRPRIENLLVVENVPSFGAGLGPGEGRRPGGKTVIGYFGSLARDQRGLEWLLRFVQRYRADYHLVVAGQGPLAQEISRLAAQEDNIRFLGPYQHAGLLSLYQEIDFTWAYYSPDLSLHHFAAPNKFYEHLFFGTPIITSSIIPQWRTIEGLGSGISVDCEGGDGELELLHARLQRFRASGCGDIRTATQRFWRDNYDGYYEKTSRLFQAVGLAR